MSNYTAITNLSFVFGPHHSLPTVNRDLNNTYSEQFEDSQFNNLFTDRTHTAIGPDVVALLQIEIATVMERASQAN